MPDKFIIHSTALAMSICIKGGRMSQERGKLAYRDDHLASMDSAKTIVKHWRASMRQQKRSVTTTFSTCRGREGAREKIRPSKS